MPHTLGDGPYLATVGHLLTRHGVGHFVLLDAPGMHATWEDETANPDSSRSQYGLYTELVILEKN